LLLPRSCGGEEVEPRVFVAAVEEVAKADASTAGAYHKVRAAR
jgi:hypothetical protein